MKSIFTRVCLTGLLTLLLAACGQAPDDQLSQEVQRTAETHAGDVPDPTPIASEPPVTEVITSRIAYGEIDDQNLHGYLSMPADATGSLPGLIVIHEWWGLNDNIKATAERLAAEGYVTLAVDLYNGEIATTGKQAIKQVENLNANSEAALSNLDQAYQYLTGAAKAQKVGVVGWCMGGKWSLQTALLLPDDIDAMVMYYGNVETDQDKLATLNMPILGIFAGNDPIVSRESVEAFRKGLTDLGKRANIYVYEDAEHAFANPSGTQYNEVAAEDAWDKTIEFLARSLVVDRGF